MGNFVKNMLGVAPAAGGECAAERWVRSGCTCPSYRTCDTQTTHGDMYCKMYDRQTGKYCGYFLYSCCYR